MIPTDEQIIGSDNPLDQWRKIPVPTTVWHYTSISSFEKIIRSKSFHATDYRFLNDVEEVGHARAFANKEYLESLQSDDAIDLALKKEASQFVIEDLFKEDFKEIYISSFTEARDLLSQWRSYSGDSVGVSVGFSLAKFSIPTYDFTHLDQQSVRPCVYNSEAKKHLIAAAIAPALWPIYMQRKFFKEIDESRKDDTAPHMWVDKGSRFRAVARQYWPQYQGRQSDVRATLREIIPFLKHETFQEEREWRIVQYRYPSDGTPQDIGFRPTPNGLVPYVATSLPIDHKSNNLLLEEVLLGPGTTEPFQRSMHGFLLSQGIGIEPVNSKIPFRRG